MSAPTRCMKALSALASAFLPSRRLDYRRQRDPAGAVSGRHHPNPQSCPVSWRSTEARVAESAAACCCCLVSYRLIECVQWNPHRARRRLKLLKFWRTFTSVHSREAIFCARAQLRPLTHATHVHPRKHVVLSLLVLAHLRVNQRRIPWVTYTFVHTAAVHITKSAYLHAAYPAYPAYPLTRGIAALKPCTHQLAGEVLSQGWLSAQSWRSSSQTTTHLQSQSWSLV